MFLVCLLGILVGSNPSLATSECTMKAHEAANQRQYEVAAFKFEECAFNGVERAPYEAAQYYDNREAYTKALAWYMVSEELGNGDATYRKNILSEQANYANEAMLLRDTLLTKIRKEEQNRRNRTTSTKLSSGHDKSGETSIGFGRTTKFKSVIVFDKKEIEQGEIRVKSVKYWKNKERIWTVLHGVNSIQTGNKIELFLDNLELEWKIFRLEFEVKTISNVGTNREPETQEHKKLLYVDAVLFRGIQKAHTYDKLDVIPLVYYVLFHDGQRVLGSNDMSLLVYPGCTRRHPEPAAREPYYFLRASNYMPLQGECIGAKAQRIDTGSKIVLTEIDFWRQLGDPRIASILLKKKIEKQNNIAQVSRKKTKKQVK